MKVKIQGNEAATRDAFAKANASSKDVPHKTQQSESKTPKVKSNPLDPTRYGDWEKKGRCIDF